MILPQKGSGEPISLRYWFKMIIFQFIVIFSSWDHFVIILINQTQSIYGCTGTVYFGLSNNHGLAL